ncbi:hypothetical protein [Variovorax sp. tm]|uniref:hypothetical protein n=1 Tax=Variovorax atrisoli TaxID=3394203 RepID=UPI003A80FEB8
MAFYLRAKDLDVIDDGIVASNNKDFAEAYQATPAVVVESLQVTAPTIKPSDVSIGPDGRILIKNKEFFDKATSPKIAIELIKNLGCGSGCVI